MVAYLSCRRGFRFEAMSSYLVRELLMHDRALKALRMVDPQLLAILHPALRAYLLLKGASIPAQVKISTMNLCDNTYDFDAMSRALRQ